MKRILSILICLMLLMSFSAAESIKQPQDNYDDAEKLLTAIQSGDEENALSMMTEELAAGLKAQIGTMWAQLEMQLGAFEKEGDRRAFSEDKYAVVEIALNFKGLSVIYRSIFDENSKVAGLYFTPGVIEKEESALPSGIIEHTVTVGASAQYPLEGTLTLPEKEIIAGIVLVQGSGPSDRDETFLANYPFRDLAQGLAHRGIATLRYDKRTFTHGQQMASSPDFVTLTVDEETADDAAASADLLKALPEMAGKKIFLLGHSLGGMLASYIGTKTDSLSGYILMAGSPRKLWELIADQNALVAAELSEADADAAAQMVAQELVKAKNLTALSDDETLKPENAVFGMDAWYLRHLERIDAAALHLGDGKPLLVLQGENDRQVMKEDFILWQQKLAEHPDAQFILYPELNHLFGDYDGETPPYLQMMGVEYSQRTPVADIVIADIAAWVVERAE
ncbi:MAG: alpha/beta fold hydrolase [Eubacteriales bacterium]|nr:alpha/beta fold hydrolase [Eubacteriales bacterium]